MSGGVDDDPLDPARAVGDDLAAAQVAIGHGLLEQGPEQVEHVRPARDDALVHEELRSRLGRHGGSSRARGGPGLDGRMVAHHGRPAAATSGRPRIIAAMLLALDIGNTNLTAGLFRAGAPRWPPDARPPRRA